MSYLYSVVLPLEILTLLAAVAVELLKIQLGGRRFIFLGVAALWVLATLFRPWGASPDDWNYVVHLRLTYPLSEEEFKNTLGHSPLYYFILSAVRVFYDSYFSFMIIAASSLALKFLLIAQITRYSLLSLLGYVSIFWMLHDVVQLRAGASTLFLFSVLFFWIHSKRILAIAVAILGPFVHISAAVSLAGLPLQWAFRNRYWLAIGFIVASQALTEVSMVPPASIIELIGISNERALLTLETSTEAGGLRLTSAALVIALCLAVPSLKKINRRDLDLFFYSVVAAFAAYWFTADAMTVSSRLLQFLSVPIILLAPCFKNNLPNFTAFCSLCGAYFYLSGWVNGLMSFGGKWGLIPLP
ncbi:EpsG family protein [Erythrobacter sp. YT30]|uniref:EpsG family protein n=1 Tax=Erythrobacter sp. YT30 TaxID=1735012 RepID=UPI00076CD276|nr:EpsG family protein [Erythrobacter sp. YT30]KWV91364.1 hypothetical protein AUC45_08825 [Erythrobacter sp. YT30]